MNITEFLQRPIMGMPTWLWGGIVIGGGIVVAIYLKRRSGSSGGTLGQNNTATAAPDPNIDPNTGIPYTIESQINPATGLPAYYGGPGVNQGITGSPSPTPTPQPVDQHIQVDPRPGTGPFYQFTSPVVSAGQQWNPQQMYAAPRGAYGRAAGPYQATPWWPQMTDIADAAAGREG